MDDSCCLNDETSGIARRWFQAAGILRFGGREQSRWYCFKASKCVVRANNYNCLKKHKCLKKMLDGIKIYAIIINVVETATK